MSLALGAVLGNFKYVKLSGTENNNLHRFEATTKIMSDIGIKQAIAGTLPKNMLECAGFSLLIGAGVFIFWFNQAPDQIIPTIAMYALALYRILPSVNRLLNYINSIAYLQRSLDLVHECFHQSTEKEGDKPITFEKSIRFENVRFKYVTGGDVLKDISFEIRKSDSIAITGQSGGGKTTLADILIGLHKPTSGAIYIDEQRVTNENIRSWRSRIGYIPQTIYLIDGTVAENIILDLDPDEERIIKVLQMANIWNFLAKKEGIHTRVGEGGVRLSGGQRQRIGIARALYTNPEILVLDEATSSLDNDTEGKIMEQIYKVSENKTLIIIAHRLTTVERCKRRIEIEDGKIRKYDS
jgi:ATP-binding cassette subfamily B protein/ATP-binding cassette subfamily C protein